MKKHCLLVIILLIFILSFSNITIGFNINKSKNLVIGFKKNNQINSVWPTQGYNKQHIGRSPYSTENNFGIEKWRYSSFWATGSPVIGDDGTIYFGDKEGYFHAINSDGSLKWKYKADLGIGSFGYSPAIAEDGTIFFNTVYFGHLYALNPDGSEKWYNFLDRDVDTSITLDDDGVLYFGSEESLQARYQNNGTLKWSFPVGHLVHSTPAIDENGIIYFGCHDTYIYALYPNGTMKWKFKTGDWVHGSPSIDSNGIIYCSSNDDYFYALYPDGSQKWKVYIEGGMRSSPSIDKSGNLYFGNSAEKIFCITPNGNIKWTYSLNPGDNIWGPTAAISDDGTIYIGNAIDYTYMRGGEIIALNPDGTLKWRYKICDFVFESSPVIGQDGTIYICGSNRPDNPDGDGHLHAFGPQESNNPPDPPDIVGPPNGKVGKSYSYTFSSNDPELNPVQYYIDWGDNSFTEYTTYYGSGRDISFSHKWNTEKTYIIKAKAKDTFGMESDWNTFQVSMKKNRVDDREIFKIFDSYPLLHYIINQIFNI